MGDLSMVIRDLVVSLYLYVLTHSLLIIQIRFFGIAGHTMPAVVHIRAFSSGLYDHAMGLRLCAGVRRPISRAAHLLIHDDLSFPGSMSLSSAAVDGPPVLFVTETSCHS